MPELHGIPCHSLCISKWTSVPSTYYSATWTRPTTAASVWLPYCDWLRDSSLWLVTSGCLIVNGWVILLWDWWRLVTSLWLADIYTFAQGNCSEDHHNDLRLHQPQQSRGSTLSWRRCRRFDVYSAALASYTETTGITSSLRHRNVTTVSWFMSSHWLASGLRSPVACMPPCSYWAYLPSPEFHPYVKHKEKL